MTGLLIDALTSKGPQFTVSGVGNVIAGGSITGTQLISTLASGTPPLQVSSTTVVPNLNASLLGGFAAGAFAPAGGSNAYIQNGTATQTGSNFNVDGNGTVGGILSGNAVISASSYKIGGSGVVLSVGTAADQNLFLGGGAGTNNTPGSGQGNMFSGYNAGLQNTSGNDNTFSGASAGLANTTGSHNTFVGMSSGLPVVTGSNNTFLGFNAGLSAGLAASNDIYIANRGGRRTSELYASATQATKIPPTLLALRGLRPTPACRSSSTPPANWAHLVVRSVSHKSWELSPVRSSADLTTIP